MKGPISNKALAAAGQVLAAKGRSFHWARRLLSPVHAGRATRLYAFCRHLDDLVDEAATPAGGEAALTAARIAIETGQTSDAQLQDGLSLITECAIDPEIVLELIRGLASDLGPVRLASEAELLQYCYQVAGTVGLMMCRVMEISDPAALAHAVDLGTAMQLTNICRDVAADAGAGRRYLPATLTGEIDPAALIAPTASLQPMLRRTLATLLEQADFYYESGERGLPYLPFRARCGILVAARVYRAIGTRLQRRDFAYWQGRAVVPDWAKAGISLRALVTLPLCSRFWRCRTPHGGAPRGHSAGLTGTGGPDAC
jgi:phytoene synthase